MIEAPWDAGHDVGGAGIVVDGRGSGKRQSAQSQFSDTGEAENKSASLVKVQTSSLSADSQTIKFESTLMAARVSRGRPLTCFSPTELRSLFRNKALVGTEASIGLSDPNASWADLTWN